MSYENPRINLMDTTLDMLCKMSEGNPGGLNVLMQLMEKGAAIDPDDFMGGIGAILSLDTHDIYGSRIWVLYKDISGSNLVTMCALLRAVQLGFLAESELTQAIINHEMDARRINEMVDQVKTRLPKFGQTEPASEATISI